MYRQELAEITHKLSDKKKNRFKINYLFRISQLGSGIGFGEFALINSRPRSATVIAEEDTWCAVLLKGIQKVEFVRGQLLYDEGDTADKIFFLVDGEYELSKSISVISTSESKHIKYSKMCPSSAFLKYLQKEGKEALLDYNKNIFELPENKEDQNSLSMLQKKSVSSHRLCILSRDESVGAEEYFIIHNSTNPSQSNKLHRFFKVQCVSDRGVALIIPFTEFDKRVKHEDTIKMLRFLSLERIDLISKRLDEVCTMQNKYSCNYARSSIEDSDGPQTSFYKQLILSNRPSSKIQLKKSNICQYQENNLEISERLKNCIKETMRSDNLTHQSRNSIGRSNKRYRNKRALIHYQSCDMKPVQSISKSTESLIKDNTVTKETQESIHSPKAIENTERQMSGKSNCFRIIKKSSLYQTKSIRRSIKEFAKQRMQAIHMKNCATFRSIRKYDPVARSTNFENLIRESTKCSIFSPSTSDTKCI